MKKLLSLLAAVALVLTLAGCGSTKEETKTPEVVTPEQETVEKETETEKEPETEPIVEPENEAFANSFIKSFTTTNYAGEQVNETYLTENDLNILVVGHSQINNLTNNYLSDFGKFAREGVSVKCLMADMDTTKGKSTVDTFFRLFKTDFDVLYPTPNLHKNVIDQITEFPTILFLDNEGNKVREDYIFTTRSDLDTVNGIIDELIAK